MLKYFLHGADYCPEQWIKYPEILKQDIEFMKKAHVNVVSIGMFSWAFLELEEGKYTFEWLDNIVDILTENDIKIIMGTPSAAMPRWMAQKYPEVLRVNENNQRNLYSSRVNFCYTSPIYRNKVTHINTLLAKRYSKNKNVVLWHISNEYHGECRCELCQKEFRQWLMKKYENDLERLNDAWWTSCWSHTVTGWEQIEPPFSIGESKTMMSGMTLDWNEFVTYQTTDFMKAEIQAIKNIDPNAKVTTNFMGPEQQLDYNYMKNWLDIISWDAYPLWHSERGDIYEACAVAFAHDMQRSFLHKPFLLMESTPSLANWMPYNALKKPGVHKLSSMQAVAHGSNSVQYFQWRKSRGFAEKYHGAVIDHNGKADGRVFNEVADVGKTLNKIGEIVNSETESHVAVVYDFKNRWAITNASGFHNDNDDKLYRKTCIDHYSHFWKRGVNIDVIGADSDLSKYKIVVLPMLYSISEEQIDKIEKYVANGGTVIATYITGYVNQNDLCYLGGFPGGKLKDVFGLTADEIDTLYEGKRNRVKVDENIFDVIDYCELITPISAEVLGKYEEDFYAGSPAVLVNKYKKGKAYYVACRDTGELLDYIYGKVISEEGIDFYTLPQGVTIHSRINNENEYVFVENYSNRDVEIDLMGEYIDLETDEYICKKIAITKYSLRILKVIKSEFCTRKRD